MMDKYATEHIRFESIMIASDKNLDQKASKFSLRELKEHIHKTYIAKEKMDLLTESHEGRIAASEKEIDTIKEVIGLLKVNIRKDIIDNVKRASMNMNQARRKTDAQSLKKR